VQDHVQTRTCQKSERWIFHERETPGYDAQRMIDGYGAVTCEQVELVTSCHPSVTFTAGE